VLLGPPKKRKIKCGKGKCLGSKHNRQAAVHSLVVMHRMLASRHHRLKRGGGGGGGGGCSVVFRTPGSRAKVHQLSVASTDLCQDDLSFTNATKHLRIQNGEKPTKFSYQHIHNKRNAVHNTKQCDGGALQQLTTVKMPRACTLYYTPYNMVSQQHGMSLGLPAAQDYVTSDVVWGTLHASQCAVLFWSHM